MEQIIRHWFDNECSAFCYVHRALERGDIIVKIGKEEVDGEIKYWADELL